MDILNKTKEDMAKSRIRLLCETTPTITDLENEWAKYKYLILGKNPNGYKKVRALLKNKSAYPADKFFTIVDESLSMPENPRYEVNAAQHVLGYFKKVANAEEKKNGVFIISRYRKGKADLSDVKQSLFLLAKKYNVNYLLSSYYFVSS